MAEFYKFEIANWNEGTANLTLEQEAAYLRVVNAIRLADQPLTFNKFVLCGLWRCNDRKAERLLRELVDAGKVKIEGGKIVNDKAVDDASTLRRLRADRASAGRRGGIESAKTRAKSLENNNTCQAIASTREEKRREEEKEEANASSKKRSARLPAEWVLPKAWGVWAVSEGMSETDVRREAERFRDYWHSIGGQRAVKLDWQATWRNWVRKVLDERKQVKRQFESGDERVLPNGKKVALLGGQWVEVVE